MKTRRILTWLLCPALTSAAVHEAAAEDPGTPDLSTVTYTPIPTNAGMSRTLNGTWKFRPAEEAGEVEIEVPGQWRNQGHVIAPEQTVVYQREFGVPDSWDGRRIKLRFDAVFSHCEVRVNGRQAGSHTGGFTPFELDITGRVEPGANLLEVRVVSMSLADEMASASRYACHPLGGISRDVTLFSVPAAHLDEVVIRTDMDKRFEDATLRLGLRLGLRLAGGPSESAALTLRKPDGGVVFSEKRDLRAGDNEIAIAVERPARWTPETPALHTLEITVAGATTRHPVGFREVRLEGTQLLVNGRPVKLRGVNRHEVHPLRGRSLPAGLWETDVRMFRDANCNLIRTCHYPPSLELGTAADKLGMWLEVEGPFCWENGSDERTHRELTERQLVEMVKAWRNHPSVLFWSLANESKWGDNFALASELVDQLDPDRPRTFNWMSGSVQRQDEKFCGIANIHYPGYTGAPQARSYDIRPLYFGEYAHLNAYNRRELMTDPGLRDVWVRPFEQMWETMWNEPSVLGGALWSGIDDTFFLDDNLTIGYGAWGPIDAWRREKPEHWNIKKVYSPVRVANARQPRIDGGTLTVDVENRGDFLNFEDFGMRWQHAGKEGEASVDLAPRQKGELRITVPGGIQAGEPVELTVTHPSGYVVDRFSFATGGKKVATPGLSNPELAETSGSFQVTCGEFVFDFDRKTGATTARKASRPVIVSGPHLVITPNNSEGNTQMEGETKMFDAMVQIADGWNCKSVSASDTDGKVVVTIQGDYAQAEGGYMFSFTPGEPLRLTYDFTSRAESSPRQLGVAFDLPKGFSKLTWERSGRWTTYPDDHVGRNRGVARLRYENAPEAIEIGPRTQPATPWGMDNTRYGSNDFRATKRNIRRVSLTDGSATFRALAADDGTHFQAILIDGLVRAQILSASTCGSERFLRRISSKDDVTLKKGGAIHGMATLEL